MAFKLSSLALAACLGTAIYAMPGSAPRAQGSPQVRLPALGEAESDELGIGDERRIGDQIMRAIANDPDVLDDAVLAEYLDSIFKPLLAAARQRGDMSPEEDAVFAWQPFLVRDRTFNAFALPGGFVGVHLGLIAASGSVDELASVLGHELSHVTQRHIARSMANSRRQTLAATLGMILGLLAAARTSNGDVPMAILAGSQAAAATGQLTFSREMEREADRFGMEVMTTAGFSPTGMTSMFERLEMVTRLNDSNQYPWLRSHPLTIERIAEARLRAGEEAAQHAPAVRRPVEHQMMRARARVLMDPSEGSLRRIQEQGRRVSALAPADHLGALYGGALASILLRDFAAADAMLESARQYLATGVADGGAALARSRGPSVAVAQAASAAAAPVAEAAASGATGPSVPPMPGLSLAEGASTATGPAVDIASPVVHRDFALLRLQLAIARRASAAEVAAATAPLQRDPTRPALVARGESAVARAVLRDPGAPAALHQDIEQLQAWVSEHRNDALAWAVLSQCADAAGQKLRAIRAEAESHAAKGDLTGAIDRLRAGQRLSGGPGTDFVEASIIDTRLRELEAARREVMKQERER